VSVAVSLGSVPRKNAGIKIHTLLDLRGNIPSFLQITPAKIHDVNFLDQLIVEPGSFYIMDRGYLDFARLYTVNQCLAYFIIRPRKNFQFQRIASSPELLPTIRTVR
jgi:hypothetical protein